MAKMVERGEIGGGCCQECDLHVASDNIDSTIRRVSGIPRRVLDKE